MIGDKLVQLESTRKYEAVPPVPTVLWPMNGLATPACCQPGAPTFQAKNIALGSMAFVPASSKFRLTYPWPLAQSTELAVITNGRRTLTHARARSLIVFIFVQIPCEKPGFRPTLKPRKAQYSTCANPSRAEANKAATERKTNLFPKIRPPKYLSRRPVLLVIAVA